ncbi:MAG: DUF3137 domain-containing protein [Bacteroidales bacterium]|nr:DUF3137 domain-containing protein [Bacteroidales bacterium]
MSEFQQFFRNELQAKLKSLDKRRRNMLWRCFLVILLMIIFVPLAYLIVNAVSPGGFKNETNIYVFLGLCLLNIIIGVIVFRKWGRDRKLYSDFKSQIIGNIVQFVNPSLQYEAHKCISYNDFKRSRIFLQDVDRYRGDDLVYGMIDKTQISFSEIKAEYETHSTDSDGNSSSEWHTLFKGIFFVADFNKDFNTSTIVLPNRFGKGFLGNFFKKINLNRKEKFVALEDPNFNKHFVVYSMDQVEARYILSPALMQRIVEFKEKRKEPIYISFVKSQMYIAISYKRDLFEPRYFAKIANYKKINEYYQDLQLAVSIVEELNLNNRIWTKQ